MIDNVKLNVKYQRSPAWLFQENPKSFFISYYLKSNEKTGVGIYADEVIKKDTIIWTNTENSVRMNKKMFLNTLKQLSYEERYNLLFYSTTSNNEVFLDLDESKYLNHSDNPNCQYYDSCNSDNEVLKVLRSIEKDEQITFNYNQFGPSPAWYKELCNDHNLIPNNDLFSPIII